ncbi:hypothetical protein I8752_28430 [Nostocaceae cyanobacterium CENA369]|uniref:N-acetyltransferase domain-containing protein n=1 Tax=Dendronalium phyllosphericum CENA369 TaxID=1725256 RepID=A0A8J7IDW9_9NOST|nr:hypothetical protein [Dendronalium phyllosphericum]MBH8576846.1 hypothetical protein [Dendronalium phyllosphericum CENA369]
MKSDFKIVVKNPHSCSAKEIEEFICLISAGEEVSLLNLESRVLSAQNLVFLYEEHSLQGIIAVKCPSHGYRNYVSSMSSISLDDYKILFELGWLFVVPTARGGNYATQLIRSAMLSIDGEGIFATSRRRNIVYMLSKFGFMQVGNIYPSSCNTQMLQLFIHPPLVRS